MHPYIHDIDLNAEGKLSEDQLDKLKKITKARGFVGWLLVVCCAFLGGLSIIPLLGNMFEGRMLIFMWVAEVLYIIGFLYGIKIIAEQKKNAKMLGKPKVRKVVGKPTKVGAAVAIPHVPVMGGMMLITHLKAGTIKLEGKKYGSLNGIYPVVEDGELAEFHVVDFGFDTIKGVVVNYL